MRQEKYKVTVCFLIIAIIIYIFDSKKLCSRNSVHEFEIETEEFVYTFNWQKHVI